MWEMNVQQQAEKRLEICYVEDDPHLREHVVTALSEQGFSVRGYPGSRELYLGLLKSPCDIAILDVGLPGEDGFTIAANLRAASSIGIVMLTASADMEDRVQGLMGGADAYLVKPVEIRELVATLHSLARRLGMQAESDDQPDTHWSLTLDDWHLVAPGAVQISLTASERCVLRAVLRAPDVPVPRETLVAELGHDTEYYLPHRLDMLISRLRRKVLQQAGRPLPLKAIRGVGFVFSTTERG